MFNSKKVKQLTEVLKETQESNANYAKHNASLIVENNYLREDNKKLVDVIKHLCFLYNVSVEEFTEIKKQYGIN